MMEDAGAEEFTGMEAAYYGDVLGGATSDTTRRHYGASALLCRSGPDTYGAR
jgi:hypothetical protein